MFTQNDWFNCPVIKEIINGVQCWKYLGNDLKECCDFAQKVQSMGEKFYDPLTKEVTGVHTAVLDKAMVTLLIAMEHYHKYNDYPRMSYPDDFPLLDQGTRGFTGEYAYLVHFGLLCREREGEFTYYRLTTLGREFIKGGKKVCPVLFNTAGQIHGYDETVDRVHARSFFSVGEWEEMQNPLWFLPEKHRQEILTEKELVVA